MEMADAKQQPGFESSPATIRQKKRYTPIVLRFGYLHSYWRTLTPIILIFTVNFLIMFYLGLIDQIITHIPFTILAILLYILAIWTIRDTVAGYDELFDIFDEQTEQELNLYTSMDRPPSQAQRDLKSLFKDDTAYDRFREKVRSILFNRGEIILIFLAIVVFVVGASVFFFMEAGWEYLGVIIYPWTHIVVIIFAAGLFLIALFAFGALLLFLGIMRAISELGKSSSDLKVQQYIDCLRGAPFDPELAIMSYEHFYNNASIIGRFIYRVTFRVIIILVVAALYSIFLDIQIYRIINLSTWVFSISIIIAGFLIFVIPQTGLHKILYLTKDGVINGLEEVHGRLKIQFIESLRATPHTTPPAANHTELREDIETLRQIIYDTREGPTFSFRMPTALKLLLASTIPIIVAVLQTLLLRFIGF